MLGSIACREANGDQAQNNFIIACGGDEDRDEHTVQSDTEGAGKPKRQDTAYDSAERGAERPTGDGDDERAVRVLRINGAGARNRDAEQLVGKVKGK